MGLQLLRNHSPMAHALRTTIIAKKKKKKTLGWRCQRNYRFVINDRSSLSPFVLPSIPAPTHPHKIWNFYSIFGRSLLALASRKGEGPDSDGHACHAMPKRPKRPKKNKVSDLYGKRSTSDTGTPHRCITTAHKRAHVGFSKARRMRARALHTRQVTTGTTCTRVLYSTHTQVGYTAARSHKPTGKDTGIGVRYDRI